MKVYHNKKKVYMMGVLGILIMVAVMVIYLRNNREVELEAVVSPKIELSIMTMFGGTDAARETFEGQLQAFMASHPEIEVVNHSMTSIGNEYRIAVKTAYTTGNEPDMMFFYTGSDAEGIIKADGVMNLEAIRETYPNFADHIEAEALASVRESDGSIYAIPVTGFYEGLYVNKDLFDAYGLELPNNWDNFIQAIKVFQGHGITPIASPLAQSYYILEHFILMSSQVEEYYDLLDGPVPDSWVEGLNTIKDIYDMGGFDQDGFSNNVNGAQQDFVTGQAAMIFEGSWFSKKAEACSGQVTLMPMPLKQPSDQGNNLVIGGFSSGYYVSRKAYESDKQEALMTLFDYLIRDESIEAIALSNGGVPSSGVQVAASSSIVKDGWDLMANADHLVMPIDSRLITEAFSYMITEGLPYLLYGELSAEEILEEVKRIQHR